MIRSWALAAVVVALAPPARATQEDQHVWGELSFDVLEWKTHFNYLQIAEGLQLGNDGYLFDPHLLNYSISGGVLDLHVHRDQWSNSFGWNASGSLTVFPASNLPLLLRAHHTTQGLAPGDRPALNLSEVTEFGGQWLLRFPELPELRIEAWHTLLDFDLGPDNNVFPGASPEPTQVFRAENTRGAVEIRRRTGRHDYDIEVAGYDRSDENVDQRERRARFRATNRSLLIDGMVLDGVVVGNVGEVGNLRLDNDRTTAFADYRARLALTYLKHQRIQLLASNDFRQVEFGEAKLIGNDLIGETYIFVREWLEIFGGIAVTYLEERAQAGASQQRVAREQLGSGVRVTRPIFGGDLRGQLLLRIGDSQVIDEGRGLLLGARGNVGWSHPLGRTIEMLIQGQVLAEHDRSPLGSTQGDYGLKIGGNNRRSQSRLQLDGFVLLAHRHREEPVFGTFTDRATDVALNTSARYRFTSDVDAAARAAYAYYLASEVNAEHRINGELQLAARLGQSLFVTANALWTTRLREDGADNQMRAEANASWRIRQLSIDLNYQFLLDDYRGIEGGEHRVMTRLVRRFDIHFGGTP